MVRAWDSRVDQIIFEKIRKDGQAFFNKLIKEIRKTGVPISQKKIQNHLSRMREQGIIETNDERAPGKTYPIKFTATGISMKNLGVLELVHEKNGRTVETKEGRKKRAIKLLFAIASLGSMKLVTKSIDKRSIQEPVFEAGVSIKDALGEKINLARVKEKFVDRFSAAEIKDCLDLLEKEKIFRPISDLGDERRFDFVDPKMHKFVFEWNYLLDSIVSNMEDEWAFLRVRRKPEEIDWLKSILSKQAYKSKLSNLDGKREQHYKQQLDFCKTRFHKFYTPDLEVKIKEVIRREDKKRTSEMKAKLKNRAQALLQEKEFNDIRQSHKYLYDLTIELAYPKFLR